MRPVLYGYYRAPPRQYAPLPSRSWPRSQSRGRESEGEGHGQDDIRQSTAKSIQNSAFPVQFVLRPGRNVFDLARTCLSISAASCRK
eukprot:2232459-Rhodomonas_salina.1